MQLLIQISIIGLLFLIAFEDFKKREISLIPLVAVFILNLLLQFFSGILLKKYLIHIAVNAGVIIIIIGILTVYFSLKNKTLTNITAKQLGLGDIILFFIIATFFSPLNFMLFLLVTLVISLISVPFIKQKTIPLAGIQSFGLALLIIITLSESNVDFRDDNKILAFLTIYDQY